MSFPPNTARLEQTEPALPSSPPSQTKTQDINKSDSTDASPLEKSDSDVPSSLVEEMEMTSVLPQPQPGSRSCSAASPSPEPLTRTAHLTSPPPAY
ncbi:hypothetical protein BDZ97DRAFT_1912950 [Flammula alnicola]|nr:hypothetical protein BDZ97DRAFT_1912950 [Flammula alnicola]